MKIVRYNSEVLESIESKGTNGTVADMVRPILEDVRVNGDEAVRKYTIQFDKVEPDLFRITKDTCEEALSQLDAPVRQALEKAAKNLRLFAQRQLEQARDFEMEINPGVFTGQRVVPLERVGVYVPGGNFPLVSSLLMGAVPARVAGVKEIAVCTPPGPGGKIDKAILAAAAIAGADELYAIGGVQAVGAMAYGTESVKPVDKIVGPGNQYVTAAKKEVFGTVGIDFVAGPSEVMVIADEYANPAWIAADLLAQAEHDTQAEALLITDSPQMAQQVAEEVKRQLKTLETRAIAQQAINKQGRIILVDSLEQAVAIANRQAPEHLELHVREPQSLARACKHFGTLFCGAYAAEVLGDYSSGLNHTLPTEGAARYTGGLSVRDFIKIQTTLRVDAEGLKEIGEPARLLAEQEGLKAHAKAVSERLSVSCE